MPWLLVLTLNDTHLTPTVFQPLILLLFPPEIPLSGHLLTHKREWVIGDVKFTFSALVSIVLMLASQAHVAE